MELITKKNITAEKLRGMYHSGMFGNSAKFHLATEKGVIIVKLVSRANRRYMLRSIENSSYALIIKGSDSTRLAGTYADLVATIKSGNYDLYRRGQ